MPWQRSQVSLQQNAQAYDPHLDLKATVPANIRAIFNAPNRTEAEVRLGKLVQTHTTSTPR